MASTGKFRQEVSNMYPYWQKAYAAKSKFGEFVEVPIFFEHKSGTRIALQQSTDKDATPSSFDRLMIYKTLSGHLSQRIITYIPDEQYLKRHNGDVSHNQITKLDTDFDGYLMYQTIKGEVRFVLKIVNGKAVKKLNVRQKNPKEEKNSNVRTAEEICIYPYIEHLIQYCTIRAPDGPDGPLYEDCGEWELEWIEWLDPICVADGDPCLDPANACTAECNDMGYCDEDGGPQVDCANVVGGSAYMSPCGCVGGTTNIICQVPDPCSEVATRATNTTISNQNSAIRLNTLLSPFEFGVEQNLKNLSNRNDFVDLTPRSGSTSEFTPNFTWNDNDGYTVGASHGHDPATAPSPADVVWIYGNLSNQSLIASGDADVYRDNVTVTALTSTTTYVVMPNAWGDLQAKYDEYNREFYEQNGVQKNHMDDQYGQLTELYKLTHPGATDEQGSLYALLTIFGNAIQVLAAPLGSNVYQNAKIDANGVITTVPCN